MYMHNAIGIIIVYACNYICECASLPAAMALRVVVSL